MKLTCTLSIALFLSGAGMIASAAILPPAPNSVQNPGSNFLPGLPGYGSAQGSIIVVYGSNLGPASLVQAHPLPLGTTLSNTSITVTVGATTVNLLMVYTFSYTACRRAAIQYASRQRYAQGHIQRAERIDAYCCGGQRGGNSDGERDGHGPGGRDARKQQLITATNAANTNEEIQIYATGIAGLPGGSSDASAPGAVQFPTTNVSIYVGGTKLDPSAIKYYGRNPSDPGLDQINIVLPPASLAATWRW